MVLELQVSAWKTRKRKAEEGDAPENEIWQDASVVARETPPYLV